MSTSSCVLTKHTEEFHILYKDFQRICRWDNVAASALRAFETKSAWRARDLIERYALPDGYLPAPCDMWIEMTLRELEQLTLHSYSKSTYARVLMDIAVVSDSEEEAPVSLLSLGFIERRSIARATSDEDVPEVPTWMYRDEGGVYIIVDEQGKYLGFDGASHSAPDEGYSHLVTQYRYCKEAIDTALSRASWCDPPGPQPRWKPITQRRKGAITPRETTNPQHDSASMNESSQISATTEISNRGGILDWHGSFTKENITEFDTLSTSEAAPEARNSHIFNENSGLSKFGQGRPRSGGGVQGAGKASRIGRNKNQNHYADLTGDSKKDSAPRAPSFSLLASRDDIEARRRAPLSPETILALTSASFPVPDRESIEASGDPDLIAWYYAEWHKPAERLYAATMTLAPEPAWLRIDWTTRYMVTPGSPSWFVAGRARQSAITLRHVADNFTVQWSDLQRKHWQPVETTPYTAPPMTEYERGYGGVEVAPPIENTAPTAVLGDLAEQDARLPTTDEVPAVRHASAPPEVAPALYAMSREDAADLADLIAAQYPQLSLGCQEYEDGSIALCVEHAPDAWITLLSHNDWYNPPPITLRLIKAAIAFGESRAGEAGRGVEADKENDIGAETGAIMEEMT